MTIDATTRRRGGPAERRKRNGTGTAALCRDAAAGAGFTLIELIVVMALLATVLAVAVPSLSRFFRSRSLESEAMRFLALTRAAQSRAVAEGLPMVVWFDERLRAYGLNADPSYVEDDPKAERFKLDETLELDLRYSSEAVAANRDNPFQNERQTTRGLYTLHFNPDGFLSLGSPEMVVFRQGKGDELWVAQSRNRLKYEIQTANPASARR